MAVLPGGDKAQVCEDCDDEQVEGQLRLHRVHPPLHSVRVKFATMRDRLTQGECAPAELAVQLRRGMGLSLATIAVVRMNFGPRTLHEVLQGSSSKTNGIHDAGRQHLANAAEATSILEVFLAAATTSVKLIVGVVKSHLDHASTADVFEHRLLPWVLRLPPHERRAIMEDVAKCEPVAGALLLLNLGAGIRQRVGRDLTVFDGQGVAHAVYDQERPECGRSLFTLCALYAAAARIGGAVGARRGGATSTRQAARAAEAAETVASAASRRPSRGRAGSAGAGSVAQSVAQSVYQRVLHLALRLRGGAASEHNGC